MVLICGGFIMGAFAAFMYSYRHTCILMEEYAADMRELGKQIKTLRRHKDTE